MTDGDVPITARVESYYSGKADEFGATPKGVDWNDETGQVLRFEKLLQIVKGENQFTINDIGCGYGAVLDILADDARMQDYLGLDLSARQIALARQSAPHRQGIRFMVAEQPDRARDFSIASGIFNVKMGVETPDWVEHMNDTLDMMDAYSSRGFAFNMLSTYSDPEYRRADLHYADPCAVFDYCKTRFAPDVSLLHDYGLYEFTILVRKDRTLG